MQEYSIDIGIEGSYEPALPSFTFSHTLPQAETDNSWMPAAEIVRILAEKGFKISKQTLFIHERAGSLTTRRISARKVLFNLKEIEKHFNK